ncbi:MAG TPA: MFS transporter [bacterium]|nr:MFS transporter [bacterium]
MTSDSPPPAEPVPPRAPAGGAAHPHTLLTVNNALSAASSAAMAIVTPFVPLDIAAQGGSDIVIGMAVGAAGLLPLLLSVHVGALVDERGVVFVSKAAVVIYVVAGVLLVAGHSIPAVTVAYALMGVGSIAMVVATQTVIAAVSDPSSRIRNFGYYSVWSAAGSIIGPIGGGFVAQQWGFQAAFALVLVCMVPAYPLATLMRSAPKAPRHTVSLATAHTHAGTVWRQAGVPAILIICFIVVCGQTLKQSFFSIYLQKVGLSATLIGLAYAADSLCQVAVRPALGPNVVRFGYGTLLVAATAMAAVALGVTPLLHTFWPLVLASGLMGISTGVTQPATMSMMAEVVGAEFWGLAMGIRQVAQRSASVLSPVVFGVIINVSSIEAAFYVGAAVLAGSVPIVGGLTRQFQPPAKT